MDKMTILLDKLTFFRRTRMADTRFALRRNSYPLTSK
jgi:hypothetical protein